MKVLIITDCEYKTPLLHKLQAAVDTYLEEQGAETELIEVERGELQPCMGCFGCWVKKPGQCVIGDRISNINQKSMQSDAVITLTPVIFGQFSANLKNVVDRWLPNMLPLFVTRPDGSTMHPPRYDTYPRNVFIGYGDGLSDGDARLFADINSHRSNAETLIYRGDSDALRSSLGKIPLRREAGQL